MVSAPGASEQDSPGNPGTPPQAQPADLDAYSQEKGRPSLPRSGEIGSLPRRQRTVFLVPFTGPLYRSPFPVPFPGPQSRPQVTPTVDGTAGRRKPTAAPDFTGDSTPQKCTLTISLINTCVGSQGPPIRSRPTSGTAPSRFGMARFAIRRWASTRQREFQPIPTIPGVTAQVRDGTPPLSDGGRRRGETWSVFCRGDDFFRLTVRRDGGSNRIPRDRGSGPSAGFLPPPETVISPIWQSGEPSGLESAGRDFGTPGNSTTEQPWQVADEELCWGCSSHWLARCASCWEPW